MPVYVDGSLLSETPTSKAVEAGVGPILSGIAHTIPSGKSYTISTGGLNMDVYFNGQLLAEGVGEDYIEDTATTIKFNFNLGVGSNLSYIIRK